MMRVKLGSVLMILILGWNTVDDLFVAHFVTATDTAPPTSDDDVYSGSVMQRANVFERIVSSPMQATSITVIMPCPSLGDARCSSLGEPGRFRVGTELLYLLQSLQQ